jgi:hypothetical protein
MINVTLVEKVEQTDQTDPLHRTFYGWDEHASVEENWRNNRGYWAVGARASRESYLLFSHKGTVVMAAEVTDVLDAEGKPGRKVFEGEPLTEGHSVYDAYVGKPAPERARGARNPITYIDSEVGGWPCGCGCGTEIHAGQFVRGHEQTALHNRVAKIGTIPEFLRWFDDIHTGGKPAPVQAVTMRADGRIDLTTYPDGRVTMTFTPAA